MRRTYIVYKDKLCYWWKEELKKYPILISPLHDAEINHNKPQPSHYHLLVSGLSSEEEAIAFGVNLKSKPERLYLSEGELLKYFNKFGGTSYRLNGFQFFNEKWRKENYEMEKEYADFWLKKNKQTIIDFLNNDLEI